MPPQPSPLSWLQSAKRSKRERSPVWPGPAEMTAKRIEIMDDLIPGLSRIALLDNMENASVPAQWNELKRAALAFGIQPLLCDVKKPEDSEIAFKKAVDEHANAPSVGNDTVVIASRYKIAELAAKDRLPAIHANP